MIARRSTLAILLALACMGAASPPVPLSPQDAALAGKATAYLDDLTTASGRFVQTTADGRTSEGSFWLQRPGRARFDYDAPSGLELAADGHVVTVVDTRLRTIHSYPLGTTPLALFLARHVALDRGARIEAVRQATGGFTVVVGEGRAGSRANIALDFHDAPVSLAGWTVTDARGAKVGVRIIRLDRSAPRPAAFFVLRAPPPAGLDPATP